VRILGGEVIDDVGDSRVGGGAETSASQTSSTCASGTDPISRCSILRAPNRRSSRVTGDAAHARDSVARPCSVSPATTGQGTVTTSNAGLSPAL